MCPLTKKGEEVMRAMKRSYGDMQGERIFYASENAGKITGVHVKSGKKRKKKGQLGKWGI